MRKSCFLLNVAGRRAKRAWVFHEINAKREAAVEAHGAKVSLKGLPLGRSPFWKPSAKYPRDFVRIESKAGDRRLVPEESGGGVGTMLNDSNH